MSSKFILVAKSNKLIFFGSFTVISGSFRKVNLNNLIKKLKVIHPDYTEKSKQFQLNGNSENICSLCDNVPEKKNFNEENNLASPQMSDFLVKNMLNCPLLKTNCQNSFSLILEDERDEYGLVDSAKFPSVTRILNETMSESAKIRLEEWKKQMTLKLGIEGFQKYTQGLY